jgi:hypothetical protein
MKSKVKSILQNYTTKVRESKIIGMIYTIKRIIKQTKLSLTKKNFAREQILILTIFYSIILCGCSKSNFGVSDSFFNNIPSSNEDLKKNDKDKSNKKKSPTVLKKLKYHSVEAILGMSQDQIQSRFGSPSFILNNKNIGNTNQHYIKTWCYVHYQIENDNITHNHKILITKYIIVRFDKHMKVVSAQVVYN